MNKPHLRLPFPAVVAASLLILSLAACSDGGTGPDGPETVTVTASSQEVREGESLTFSAQVRDASGDLMPDEEVAWSSSDAQVLLVDGASGQAQAISEGTAVVTATAGSASGTATVEVLPPPVESVTVNGRFRIKAGVSYPYEVVAELDDGTVVERPIDWSVSDEGLASVSQDGELVAESEGDFLLVVEIDGREWGVEIAAYDWTQADSDEYRFAWLPAELEVENQFGTISFPELVFACDSQTGNFFAWVDLAAFVTASGAVAYTFDDGSAISQTWNEGEDFDVLFFPGTSNGPVKDFARAVASASIFGFAFREFRSEVRATAFFPTGADASLDPLFAGCPAGMVADGAEARGLGEAHAAFGEVSGRDFERTASERSSALVGARSGRVDPGRQVTAIPESALGTGHAGNLGTRETRQAVRLGG